MKKRLNILYKELVVEYKGKEVLILNKALLDQQKCWENLEHLKAVHKERLKLEDKMKRVKRIKTLRKYDEKYTELEFELQELWGFPRNANYHRFWNRPQCECPKLDNEDAYLSGYYVVNGHCKLHGHSK